jgi:hypothetical protein
MLKVLSGKRRLGNNMRSAGGAAPAAGVYSLMHLAGKNYTRREIERHVASLGQAGGVRRVVLAEGRAKGVEAFQFETGDGLDFTVLPDRGLDIPFCSFKGLNLVYQAPGGIAHPAFHDPAGFEWLRVFFGGLLTTCGLTYFGDPGTDAGEQLGLHGRYTGLPAARLRDLSRWEGEEYLLEVAGTVEEASLFGEKLRLERSVASRIGARSLTVRDRVENFGRRPAPFTILYHVNAGFPLLCADSELECSSQSVEPYDPTLAPSRPEVRPFAAPDPQFSAPGPDYLHIMAADAGGRAWAALVNRKLQPRGGPAGLGLSLRFRADTLPFLNEWRMLAEQDYVVGVEPANTKVLNRAALRREGRLPMLQPGEVREMEVELGVLEGAEEIEAFAERCRAIRSGGV